MGWQYSVLFFAFFCFLGFVLIKLYTPETKGISLEELEINLKKGEKLRNLGLFRVQI